MQNKGVTFVLEDLKRADKPLKEKTVREALNQFSQHIEAHYQSEKKLVTYGTHSFLQGLHQAYADHRPFVLSPDIIWLLICQGFAMHINLNSERLRNKVVNFQGKKELDVLNDNIQLGKPSNWESVFPEFTKQIRAYTGNEFLDFLSADFSTTSLNEKIASEITILSSVKPYFDYAVSAYICGIPEITLEGIVEDWEKIIEKVKYLKKFDLEWWVDELTPILEELLKTSKNEIDTSFWRNIYREYINGCGSPEPAYIDGWIAKFYPYNMRGERLTLQKLPLYGIEKLPSEVVRVDFQYRIFDRGGILLSSHPMEFVSGFVGIAQDVETFALRPEIGWAIVHKEFAIEKAKIKIDEEIILNNIETIPDYLFDYKEITEVQIRFHEKIVVPEKIQDIKITFLALYGAISNHEKQRLVKLLKNVTFLIINEDVYTNKWKAFWFDVKSYFNRLIGD